MAPSKTLFRLVSFADALFSPAAATLERALESEGRGATVEYAYGGLLEVASAFCLGADLGFFPKHQVRAMFDAHASLLTERRVFDVLPDNRPRLISGIWTENLAAGYWDAALGIELFSRPSRSMHLVESWFQSFLVLLRSFQGKPELSAFGALVLLGSSAEWEASVAGASRRLLRGFLSVDSPEFTTTDLAHGGATIFDGMVKLLSFITNYGEWNEALRSASERIPGFNHDEGEVLRIFAGRILRWRLEPNDERLKERWVDAAELGAYLLKAAGNRLAFDQTDAWPEGFQEHAQRVLHSFKVMTSEPLPTAAEEPVLA